MLYKPLVSMVVLMLCHRPHPFSFPLLAVFCLLGLSQARADMTSQDLGKALADSAQAQAQAEQAMGDTTEAAIANSTEELKKTMLEIENMRQERQMTSAFRPEILITLQAAPVAAAATSMIANSAMESRYKELNLIQQNTGNTPLARGLVNSTTGGIYNDNANFRVYMDYFCDPAGDDGNMNKVGVDPAFLIIDSPNTPNAYRYKCGPLRKAALGDPGATINPATPVGLSNKQIIGLPLKPYLLFFEPLTLPAKPNTNTPAAVDNNTNALGDLTFGAYAYFSRLVLGKPPEKMDVGALNSSSGREKYINDQGTINVQMLSQYPFAQLYADHVGTFVADPAKINPGNNAAKELTAPQAAAKIMRDNWGPATIEPAILAMIQSLEKQQSMSMAQYMDIMMSKRPLSPGYMMSINQMSPAQLQREKVFLMGLQSVLKYQTNRWMEMSTALAAVKK